MGKASAPLRHTRAWLVAALVAATTLFGACHKNPAASGRSSIVDIGPCILVTRAEAEGLLGTRVKAAIHRQSVLMATGNQCRYVAAASARSSDGAPAITLTVYDDAHLRTQHSPFKNAADYFHRDMRAMRASGTLLVPVHGLGATAYWQPRANLLHVLDHGVYIMVGVNVGLPVPSGPGRQPGQLRTAAQRAAAITLMRNTILPHLRAAAVSVPLPLNPLNPQRTFP